MTRTADLPVRPLRSVLAERVVIADGAMGSMLQASTATLDDFAGHEGCNEILNVTRPDIVRGVHDGYLAAGVDCVSTNTFGANLSNLGEYGIADRIFELSEAGAQIARAAADAVISTGRQCWVLGSIGPGTKLPTLGHVRFAALRDAYQANAAGLLSGGADALIVETCQDLLQAKAAIIGARRAIAAHASGGSGGSRGVSTGPAGTVLIAQVTIETTGAMLLGTEIGAALTALEPLGIDMIGLNCATGPAELTASGAYYPVTPAELAGAHETFVREFGLALVGGCCGTTPEHLAEVTARLAGQPLARRKPRPEPGVASLYQHVPFRQDGAAVIALTIDEQGQARTAEWKTAVAGRLIDDLTGNWGMRCSDIIVDCLTFPIATGQEETRRDAIETIEAIRELKRRYPDVQTTLGVSNVSFGLNPAARAVLNSVFLDECVRAGLDSAIVHASRIMPIARIPDEQRQVALDLVYDRRREGYDPLARLLDLFEGVNAAELKASRAAELAGLPLWERLKRRIIDGERTGLEADLDAALAQRPALEIVNDVLLDGMKTVGELFGSGQMQLPFVLTSAEVMKASVAYLEPHMERSGEEGKGKIVLATVKGDVHDIGKNLVDIILSNNGYDVVNIGIKQPISAIVAAAEENDADVIGMSGLLVKSTVVMRDNLAELNSRGVAGRWPVMLGGAALTRAYVEQDLAAVFDGQVRYARDAFEGLRLMDAAMAVKRGEPGAKLPELRTRKVRATAVARGAEPGTEAENQPRSDI